MLKFNNEHILTGYIKQLLSSFNLPSYRIYTKKDAQYHKANPDEEAPDIVVTKTRDAGKIIGHPLTGFDPLIIYNNYIKNNRIQRYIEDASGKKYWVDTGQHYHYNKKDLNHSRRLVIKSNVYDSYTHEYLGDYLRFLRDYHDIDLMSLYNCFSNTICNRIYLNTEKAIFDSSDNGYKIYILPVKFFKEYTIALSCGFPVDICCCFYDKYLDERSVQSKISKLTYVRYSSLDFNSPVVFNKLLADNIKTGGTNSDVSDWVKNENNLKLLIKIPAACDTSIVVLEGNYEGFNEAVYTKKDETWVSLENKFITNYETTVIGEDENNPGHNKKYSYPEVSDRDFTPYTRLQLLELNTGISYPFADRLIEYLLGNAITPLDEISDDITRVQKTMEINKIDYEHEGAWENKIRNIIYDYMNSDHPDYSITKIVNYANRDCLGYVDKDAERYYTGWYYKKNGEPDFDNSTTIGGIDLYEETYPK